MLCAVPLSWTIYCTEWNMLIQASTCKCFRGEIHALSCTHIFAQHSGSKYKLSISTTAIKMCCSAPEWGQEQLFLSRLFPLHSQYQRQAPHSRLARYWSLMPRDYQNTVHRGHLSPHIHLCPWQWHDYNRICCCELDYELSGLQSVHDTNTDMIQTDRLRLAWVGEESCTKYREGKCHCGREAC